VTLPSQEEINVYNSLDGARASRHFYHKTLEEAEALFRENSLYYQEDLMWMGPKAFRFYLPAAISYLQSDAAADDSDFVSALFIIIEFREGEEDFHLALEAINRLIEYVLSDYQKFDVDEDIYGDLFGKYRSLQTRLNAPE